MVLRWLIESNWLNIIKYVFDQIGQRQIWTLHPVLGSAPVNTLSWNLFVESQKFDWLGWNPWVALALDPPVKNSSKYICHFFAPSEKALISFTSKAKIAFLYCGTRLHFFRGGFCFFMGETYISFAWYYSSKNRSGIYYLGIIQQDNNLFLIFSNKN